MSDIFRAFSIAKQLHAGQTDKAGADYFLHPLRVMGKVETLDEMIVAILHDTLEDCPDAMAIIDKSGFSIEILAALVAITHIELEPYDDYINRVSRNKLASKVKVYDLLDNLDERRLSKLDSKLASRLRLKYLQALDTLAGGI